MSQTIERRSYPWGRAYIVQTEEEELIFPSVTTVLKLLENDKYEKLRKEFGDERWDKILYNAAERGTIMHRMLELFLLEWDKSRDVEKSLKAAQEYALEEANNSDDERLKIVNKARNLFWNFYHDKFWESISEVVENEIFLWTKFKGGWAGASDFVFRNLDKRLVVDDFKSSTREKSEEDILGYKLQISAYMFMCAEKYREVPVMGRIRISNENSGGIQTFIVHDYEMKEYLKIFLDLLEKFRSLHLNPETI
jgi:hypothetical protein